MLVAVAVHFGDAAVTVRALVVCVFLLLTVLGVRRHIIAAIPAELRLAIAAGIGLFITFIGCRTLGLVADDPATLVRLGELDRPVVLGLAGLAAIVVLEKALELLGYLKEDSEHLAAQDLHELLRCWENTQRMWQAEAHARTILFREETRWPGYYFRADKPSIDNENWLAFCNCKYDRNTGEWEMIKRPVKYITQ